MEIKPGTQCTIFGCNRPRKADALVVANIGEQIENISPCDEHQRFFEVTDPETFILGYTFLGEVQVRLLKQQPAVPAAPEE